jgi:hypothetical protein
MPIAHPIAFSVFVFLVFGICLLSFFRSVALAVATEQIDMLSAPMSALTAVIYCASKKPHRNF